MRIALWTVTGIGTTGLLIAPVPFDHLPKWNKDHIYVYQLKDVDVEPTMAVSKAKRVTSLLCF